MLKIGLCLSLFVLLVTSTYADNLVFVLEVCRHGDRTPVATVPTCNNTWPQGLGQLTDIGAMQQYNLGKYVRSTYGHLIPPTYNEKNIYVRSTDVNRTLMSAESQLFGLYEGTGPLPGGYQPVPIHTLPVQIDTLLREFDSDVCPRYGDLVKRRILKSPAVVDFEAEHHEFIVNITDRLGYSGVNLGNWYFLYDPVWVCHLYNKTCPNVTAEELDEIVEIQNFMFTELFSYPEARQMIAGNLIRDIRDHVTMVINEKGEQELKFVFYSAHDTTVGSLLGGLGLFDGKVPPYAAHVFFEVRNVTEEQGPLQFNVSIVYNNVTLKSFSYAEFLSFVNPDIPADWEGLCNDVPRENSLFFSLVIGFVLLATAATALVYFMKRRRSRQSFTSLDGANRSEDYGTHVDLPDDLE